MSNVLKELNAEELINVNGSGPSDWLKGGIFYDVVKTVTVDFVKKLHNTPYETTAIRQGKEYTVKYTPNGTW